MLLRLAAVLVVADLARRAHRYTLEQARADALAAGFALGHREGRDVGRSMLAHPSAGSSNAKPAAGSTPTLVPSVADEPVRGGGLRERARARCTGDCTTDCGACKGARL